MVLHMYRQWRLQHLIYEGLSVPVYKRVRCGVDEYWISVDRFAELIVHANGVLLTDDEVRTLLHCTLSNYRVLFGHRLLISLRRQRMVSFAGALLLLSLLPVRLRSARLRSWLTSFVDGDTLEKLAALNSLVEGYRTSKVQRSSACVCGEKAVVSSLQRNLVNCLSPAF